jgi:hypothetical protein
MPSACACLRLRVCLHMCCSLIDLNRAVVPLRLITFLRALESPLREQRAYRNEGGGVTVGRGYTGLTGKTGWATDGTPLRLPPVAEID